MSGRPKDPVWEHGDNLAPGWRCNYCGMQKSGGGSIRFKQHLAAGLTWQQYKAELLRVRGLNVMSIAEYNSGEAEILG